jgi:cell division septal protein FtsQ
MKLVGNKKAIRSPEFHEKKERERKIRLALVVLAVTIVIVGPILILRIKALLISNIQISGNQVTASADIESIVANDLSGDYLWVIPKSSALLYPKSKIKNDILSAIPRISAVEVSLSNTHSLSIAVGERTPFALYCTQVADISNPSDCYFLDSSGYIFSVAPAFSGGVYMVYASDPALDTPLRQQFMPSQQFKNLSDFIGNLSHIPLAPSIFVSKTDEYDLLLPSGTVVMWKPTQDLDTIYSNLSAFLTDPSLDKSTTSNFLYIDLRFDDKVFYKYK